MGKKSGLYSQYPTTAMGSINRVYGANKAIVIAPERRNELYWMIEKSYLFHKKFGHMPSKQQLKYHGTMDEYYVGDAVVDELWNDDFILACWHRGIRDKDAGIDVKQGLCISLLTDFTDNRTQAKKLASLGITGMQFQAWMSQPAFLREYKEQTERVKDNINTTVENVLMQKAASGSLADLKYLDQRTGMFDPDRNAALDANVMLSRVIEAVYAEVTDPAVLERIAKRLQPQAITGTVAPGGLNLESPVREYREAD